jgi:hypothetical protein
MEDPSFIHNGPPNSPRKNEYGFAHLKFYNFSKKLNKIIAIVHPF